MHFSALVTALAGLATALPSPEPHVVHEKRDGVLSWTKHSRAERSTILPVRIGLKQRNLEHGDRWLADISDPKSPNFGQHWSAEKVANAFMPHPDTSDKVTQWLTSSGIDASRLSHSKGRNWIEFDATVDEAEALLKTQYHTFQDKTTGGYRIACDSYSLPESLQQHVDFVMPTVQLDGLKPVAQAAPQYQSQAINITGLTGLANCSTLITIDCLRALYGIPVATTNHTGNQLGIAEWADYLYLPDLREFFSRFTSPKIPSTVAPEFISIDGGKPSNLTVAKLGEVVESALDFQTSYSIIYPQGIRLYQNGDSVNVDSVGTFNIFLDALDASYCTYEGGDQPYVDPAYPDPNEGGYTGPLQCGGAPLSNVFSVSYGQIEGALPRFYMERQCREWMKLALQGVSTIYASGDSGVANRYNSGYNNSCLDETNLYVDQFGKRFSPSFPNTCPYITNVGATTLLNSSIYGGEQAVADPNGALSFYSGGGFSDIFERPSWQDAAVKNYLKKYSPNYSEHIFNHSGRAFPDVSAIGLKVATVYLNQTLGVGGTSASAPIFASIITLLNEERLGQGKKPIGFLNPIIYAHPEIFNDITVGSNPGCGTAGFPTAPGWDPVTGMDSEHSLAQPDTILHQQAAHPSNIITKAQQLDLVERLAYRLRHDFGIGASGPDKDVVTVISYGQILLPAVFHAVIAAGGVYSAASPSSTVAELARQVEVGTSRLLICGAEHGDVAASAAGQCQLPPSNVLVLESEEGGWSLCGVDGGGKGGRGGGRNLLSPGLQQQRLTWERITDPVTLKQSLITILWSSGTTGLPKGVMLSHRNLVAETYITALSGRQWAARELEKGNELPAVEYRTLAHLPTSHIAGLFGYLIAPQYNGGTAIWMRKYSWGDMLTYLRQFPITAFYTVPSIYLRISKSREITDHFRHVVAASTGAAPMDGALMVSANAKLGDGKLPLIGQTWGLSETTGAITAMPKGESDDTGSISPILPSVELRMVDEEFRDVDPEVQEGELLVRSPLVTEGYWRNEKATKEAFHDGWFCTGDIGRLRGGRFYIVDRKKELLKYKGQQVAPAELENVLFTHPQIKEAAVVGIPAPDDPGTDLPRAYVVPQESENALTEDDVKRWVKERLAPYKQLRGGVVFVDEIPKNAIGKFLRRELRDRAKKEVLSNKAKL
ncbi:hypothetical protein LTR62_000086 [Meristemomyces frigidus]|uniref:Peptidase S53 domain-containing protein n=1 Tax=Meristemomyces frigidus TaxID=1508187 RepID=A0AAN7TQP5_9PEZI|nr:hypothetical protein LTR62_000086 [Meristemomyces frigidus]